MKKFETAKEYIAFVDEQYGDESWSNDNDILAQTMENYAKMYCDSKEQKQSTDNIDECCDKHTQKNTMKDTYTVRRAYWWSKENEVEIVSENLRYSEIGDTHSGLQCKNNNEKIRELCHNVADLIREIDKLNHNG